MKERSRNYVTKYELMPSTVGCVVCMKRGICKLEFLECFALVNGDNGKSKDKQLKIVQ